MVDYRQKSGAKTEDFPKKGAKLPKHNWHIHSELKVSSSSPLLIWFDLCCTPGRVGWGSEENLFCHVGKSV